MDELQEDVEFDSGEDEDVNVVELEKASEDAPVVKLVNLILLTAIKKGASDIHVEPYEKSFRVRFRIDGVLLRGDAAAAEAEERDHRAA